jgi:hypothetical protein
VSKPAVTSAIAESETGAYSAPSFSEDVVLIEEDQAAFGLPDDRHLRVRYVPCESDDSSWVEVSSKAEPVRLRVKNDGVFELYRTNHGSSSSKEGDSGTLCCSGSVTLPDSVDLDNFSVSLASGETSSECTSVTISWGKDVTLVIRSPPKEKEGDRDGDGGWTGGGIERGFILEELVGESSDIKMAEIKIDMDSAGKWFGGAHFMRQLWPLNKASLETGPFYPFDHGPMGLNTLVAPQWVTSNGLLVMMDPDTPFLHVGMNGPEHENGRRSYRKWGTGVQNATKSVLPIEMAESGAESHDGVLRLQSRTSFRDASIHHTLSEWAPDTHQGDGSRGDVDGLGQEDEGDTHSTTKARICVALGAFPNILESQMASLRTLPRPKVMPDLNVLQDPIWTTWAKYKQWVTEGKVLRYAKEIMNSGLDFSVMEIDDRWQIKYGDLDFDPAKFPDPKGMVDSLHKMGFKVTLWVMPFVEKRSAAYQEGVKKDYFVKKVTSPSLHPDQEKPGFFKWWNFPKVVALDVTNPEAVEWYVSRLKRLQDLYGIDGFKFDAGEPCFLPRNPITKKPLAYPSEYTHLWVKEVAGQFQGGVCEVRTGHRTQDVGVMTRMGDRFSTWDISNGLQSIIPTVLTSGILGYPFALPDIIGGNAYFGRKPDTELFVRWTQVNALMPVMQFSIAPWHIGNEAQSLVSQAFALRNKLIGDILDLAEDAAEALKPIVRPMWWLDPEDEATFDIFDQFVLGENIIVAPVVFQGQRSRDVYLTRGNWEDLNSPGEVIQGGRWLKNLEAPLAKLPCFRRIPEQKNISPLSN